MNGECQRYYVHVDTEERGEEEEEKKKTRNMNQSIGCVHNKLINGGFPFIEFKTPLQIPFEMGLGQLPVTNENLSK